MEATTRELVARLVASDADETYARRFSHFAEMLSTDDLKDLTVEVVGAILKRDGRSATDDHISLKFLRKVLRVRDEDADWLAQLIMSALPISLRFSIDYFADWADRFGADAQVAMYDAIVACIRRTYPSAASLAPMLDDRRPWLVAHLINLKARIHLEARGPQNAQAWRDYLPPLLLAGARTDPETFVPQLAALAGTSESGIIGSPDTYPPVFAHDYVLDRDEVTTLFGSQAREALTALANYSGANPYAVRAVDEARRWLSELPSK